MARRREAAARDKRKADGHGRNLWWQENPARVIISQIAIRMDELYRRGLRCIECPLPARGPLVQPGIDTPSYAIINVSFASGIDRPFHWQFIRLAPFYLHPHFSASRARGICSGSISGTILTASDRGPRFMDQPASYASTLLLESIPTCLYLQFLPSSFPPNCNRSSIRNARRYFRKKYKKFVTQPLKRSVRYDRFFGDEGHGGASEFAGKSSEDRTTNERYINVTSN